MSLMSSVVRDRLRTAPESKSVTTEFWLLVVTFRESALPLVAGMT